MQTRQSKSTFHHYILSSGSQYPHEEFDCKVPINDKEFECEIPFNDKEFECEIPLYNSGFKNQISQQLEREFTFMDNQSLSIENQQQKPRYRISIDFSSKQHLIQVVSISQFLFLASTV